MTTKHLRLTIDFHISIADTPPLLPEGTIDPPDEEYDAMQSRLLEAVKSHPSVLTRWMHDLIASQLTSHPFHYWHEAISGSHDMPYPIILADAIASLPVEDQAWLAQGLRHNLFEEYTDMFQASFAIREGKPVISEVSHDA